ncbi:SDR family NAD(P)-dependent oxidoreductase [Nocardioides sp. AN3]
MSRETFRPVRLAGATVLVTGASGGLGATIARRLHREGSRLVLSGRRETELDDLAAELGGETRVVVADLARVDDVRRLAEETAGVDVLVANAGLPANGRLLDIGVEEIERSVDLNIRSTLLLIRLLLPPMVERGSGHVVIIGSLAGLACTPGSSVYHASKFALRGFGQALHEELRGSGIGVSLVSPTFVSGAGMWADTGARAAHPEVTPEQVADACVEAIAKNRAEILVAPALQRLAARVAVMFPQLLQPALRSSVVPPEAVAAQKPKMSAR